MTDATPSSNLRLAITAWMQTQWERVPAVPHSQPGSYARGYDDGMVDILRGLQATLDKCKADETTAEDITAVCGNCEEAHRVLSHAGIADGDLAEKIDDLVAERDAALEALIRIRDQSAQNYEDPEQEAYASRDIARKALEGSSEKASAPQKIPPREFDIDSHQGTYTENGSLPQQGKSEFCPSCGMAREICQKLSPPCTEGQTPNGK